MRKNDGPAGRWNRDFPQRLKPDLFCGGFGTAEAVPWHDTQSSDPGRLLPRRAKTNCVGALVLWGLRGGLFEREGEALGLGAGAPSFLEGGVGAMERVFGLFAVKDLPDGQDLDAGIGGLVGRDAAASLSGSGDVGQVRRLTRLPVTSEDVFPVPREEFRARRETCRHSYRLAIEAGQGGANKGLL